MRSVSTARELTHTVGQLGPRSGHGLFLQPLERAQVTDFEADLETRSSIRITSVGALRSTSTLLGDRGQISVGSRAIERRRPLEADWPVHVGANAEPPIDPEGSAAVDGLGKLAKKLAKSAWLKAVPPSRAARANLSATNPPAENVPPPDAPVPQHRVALVRRVAQEIMCAFLPWLAQIESHER